MNSKQRCAFLQYGVAPIELNVCNLRVKSKQTPIALGILFNAIMCWAPQVSQVLKKANKALNAMKLLGNFFNVEKLIQI
jgi:hypothetical protein